MEILKTSLLVDGTPGERASVSRARESKTMHPLLLSALIQVESGGDDLARGRRGELGALQIRSVVVRDVNRIMGTQYAHTQVTNRQVSIAIANAYLSHYGKGMSDESLARIWNGGPRGAKKSSTRAYGRRVMRELGNQTITVGLFSMR